jgi:hypothetical protein
MKLTPSVPKRSAFAQADPRESVIVGCDRGVTWLALSPEIVSKGPRTTVTVFDTMFGGLDESATWTVRL